MLVRMRTMMDNLTRHVRVPYCTSDTWAGRRDPSEATNGFSFHGKTVFRFLTNLRSPDSCAPWQDLNILLRKVGWLCFCGDFHRNVMNHLSHHFNLFEATHFVLSGESAGGFGVRRRIYSSILRFKDWILANILGWTQLWRCGRLASRKQPRHVGLFENENENSEFSLHKNFYI